MKRFLVLFVGTIFLLGLWALPAAAQTMTIKYGHIAPPFHGQSKGADALAEYVKEKTKGAIEIKTFPFGQLGSETSLAEQVQTGTIQMASVTCAVLQNTVPQVAVVDLLSFFLTGRQHMRCWMIRKSRRKYGIICRRKDLYPSDGRKTNSRHLPIRKEKFVNLKI